MPLSASPRAVVGQPRQNNAQGIVDDIVVVTSSSITFDNQATTTDLTTTSYAENGYRLSGGLVGLGGTAEVLNGPTSDDDLRQQVPLEPIEILRPQGPNAVA